MNIVTDNPDTNVSTALNLFFIRNGEAYVRGYGENGEDIWMIRDIILWPVNGSSNQFVATACDSSELCLAHQQMTGKWQANKQESQRQQERKARDVSDLFYARTWAYGYLKERLKEFESTKG